MPTRITFAALGLVLAIISPAGSMHAQDMPSRYQRAFDLRSWLQGPNWNLVDLASYPGLDERFGNEFLRAAAQADR